MNSQFIECRSAAKINLTLDILGRRDDGYHLLQSLVHTLDWWDFLRLEARDGGEVSLSCSRSELESESNLCVRAVQLYREAACACGFQEAAQCGIHISLTKNIPSGGGLGGGSGNAAATLLAMNELHARVLAPQEIENLAARLGADVPLFLRGGCAVMEGVGEQLRELAPLCGHLLLVQPPQTLETPQVYARFDALPQAPQNATQNALRLLHEARTRKASSNTSQQLASTRADGTRAGEKTTMPRNAASTREMPISNAPLVETQLSALLLSNHLGNDLEAAAQSLGVDVAHIAEKLRACGALGASMSGSGSCVFGLFGSEDDAHLAHEKMQQSGDFAVLKVAQFNARGVEFLS